MEFRILPNLVWSYSAFGLGTIIAYFETGKFDLLAAIIAGYIALVAQGFTTHALNDIIDARTGADAYRGRPIGGSKVVQAGLLDEKDLWIVFWLSLLVTAPVGILYALSTDVLLLAWMLIGFLAGICYTLPPFRFAYRPFLGEWGSAFTGMMVVVTGSYFIQALTLSPLVILAATLFSLSCICIMLLFHTVDHDNDRNACPTKKTSIVFLGKQRAKLYINILACLIVIGWSGIAYLVDASFFPLFIFAIIALHLYSDYDYEDDVNVIMTTKSITWLNIGGVFITAVVINPLFSMASLPIFAGYYGYRKWGKLSKEEKELVYRDMIT